MTNDTLYSVVKISLSICFVICLATLLAGCAKVELKVSHSDELPTVEVVNVFEPTGESNVRSSFRLGEGSALIGTEETADIFRTDDGGMSWNKVFDGGDAWGIADVRNYIRAQDGNIYITTTEPALVGRSSDNGDTWEIVYRAPASRTVGLKQLDNGTILVGLRRSENNKTSIIRTEDYFKTTEWIPVSPDEPRQNTTCFGYWGGPEVLVGVGYEGSGKIYKSSDFGRTWNKKADIEGPRDMMDFFKAGDTIYALTSAIGTLYKSIDGGETWEKAHQFWTNGFLGQCLPFEWKGKTYHIISATDQSESVYRHLVMISADNGQTWTEWANLVSEAMGLVKSSKDSGGGASNLAVIGKDRIIVGVGNHAVQGRVYTLKVSD